MRTTRVSFHWRTPELAGDYETGVSLHSHTLHSHESLGFIPHYASKIPVASGLVAAQNRCYEELYGRPLNYRDCWWTPPLGAREAFELEARQLREVLEVEPIVSITDHDTLDAPALLHVVEPSHPAPFSVEWTVPVGTTFLHLGVHNIAPLKAHQVIEEMRRVTANPQDRTVSELLEALHCDAGTLIVLNHPLWDEGIVGAENHFQLVTAFLKRHGRWIHALEMNGLRAWKENQQVLEMARQTGYPVVSGGDRHGCEPNAVVNLTRSRSMRDFVQEVREDGLSMIAVMPQYREPHALRCFEVMRDALREYPESAGGKNWKERLFYRRPNGDEMSLAALWGNGGPAVARFFVALVMLFGSPHVRGAVRAALASREEVAL